jgi:hypothetical protein
LRGVGRMGRINPTHSYIYSFLTSCFTYVLPTPTRKDLKRSVPSVPFRGQAPQVVEGKGKFEKYRDAFGQL